MKDELGYRTLLVADMCHSDYGVDKKLNIKEHHSMNQNQIIFDRKMFKLQKITQE